MTFWDLLRVLTRYWAVVVVGALITAGAGLAAIRDPGTWFTRSQLVFLAPTSTLYPNALRTQSEDIIVTAGVVAKRVAGPGRITKFSSPDVTLVGLGVRDGWSLRLPDTGGQWATNFTSQILVLDVVGPTPEAVKARQAGLTERVQRELYTLQRDAGSRPVNDITVISVPESSVVYHVGGNRPRALAMTALLGIGATVTAVLLLDTRRRRRRPPAPVTPEATRSRPHDDAAPDLATSGARG